MMVMQEKYGDYKNKNFLITAADGKIAAIVY
jgi:hypothetical protein